MIVISRCPYRISLLGGGSDLDWFVDKNGYGLSYGFSIKSYTRIALCKRAEIHKKGILNYSSREEYENIESISHPLIRASLTTLGIKDPLEISSFGDALIGGGLGSSSSFTIALLKALKFLNNTQVSNFDIAKLASHIEINNFSKNIGRQDQFLCALGGGKAFLYKTNNDVQKIDNSNLEDIAKRFSANLFLINTGISRSSKKSLDLVRSEAESFKNIKEILKITETFIQKIDFLSEEDQINFLEESIIASWKIKKSLKGVFNDDLIKLEQLINNSGFKVLKLLGAGLGGYFLVKYFGDDFKKDKAILNKFNLQINEVNFSEQGCEVWDF